MYQLNTEQIQKLIEINKMLNLLEIRGPSNVSMVYKVMILMDEILGQLQNQSNGISIDTTKGGK